MRDPYLYENTEVLALQLYCCLVCSLEREI